MIRTIKYLNIVFFLSMVIINSLANTMPLGHGNTGSISNKYPNLFTPAPITFSIWIVIYLLLAIYVIYQSSFFSSQPFADSFTKFIGPWFIVSCAMNIGWIFSWHYDMTLLSLIFMLGLLVSLIIISIRISPDNIIRNSNASTIPIIAKLSIYAFDIYLGWIVAATIANVSVLLVKINWNRFGFSEEFWTIVVLIVGTLLGIIFTFASQKYMSSLAIAWAFCGILIKHISQSGYKSAYPRIMFMTALGIFLILAAILLREQKNAI